MKSNIKSSVTGDMSSKKSTGQNGGSSVSQPMIPPATSVKSVSRSVASPAGDVSASQPMNPSAAPAIPASPVVASPVGDVSGGRLPKKTNGHEGGSSVSQPMTPSAAPGSPVVKTAVFPVNEASKASSVPKRHGKSVAASDVAPCNSDGVVPFKDVAFGPQDDELRFRLIHFWEARNMISKALIGLEMLLIDEEGTVIQGYIPPGRIDTYLRHMVPGTIYSLHNYFGSKSKEVYRVADSEVTVSFTWKSVLSAINGISNRFPVDRFRFHDYEQFEAACDRRGDLYDFIGHIKLVNEQALHDDLMLDETAIALERRLLIHVQTHDGPVMKLYLWDNAAMVFCEKFKVLGKPPSVILVTTVNPKRFGGALSLSTVSASRLFVDMDVQQTREYLAWLESNSEVANRVSAEVVTKAETATIAELLSYMKQQGSKVAWFECKATIDDIVRDAPWYYIACSGCNTKATKGHTTLMCRKCGKTDITGAAEYLTKMSVYDNSEQASFVLLGHAGYDLTGKQAAELVENYYEGNDRVEDGHFVPVPQALIGAIGQERTFVIKITTHNLEGKTQTLTVTKVLPLDVPGTGHDTGEDEKLAEEEHKRASEDVVPDEAKRAKRG